VTAAVVVAEMKGVAVVQKVKFLIIFFARLPTKRELFL
jgi:hypothetical protein